MGGTSSVKQVSILLVLATACICIHSIASFIVYIKYELAYMFFMTGLGQVYMFFMTGLGWVVLNLFKMTLLAEKETMTSAINVDRVAPSARTALTFYS